MPIILPSITTYMTPDWPERIKQLEQLNLSQIALFLTGASIGEREKLYKLLANSFVKSIPHVHLRDDMETWELDLLAEKYGTKLFNVHASPKFVEFLQVNTQYRDRIYVENGSKIDDFFIEFLGNCAGLCLDFSHWKVCNFIKRPGYELLAGLAKNNKIGCAHVSAFVPAGRKFGEIDDNVVRYAPHSFEDLGELAYLAEFKQYLPDFVSLELVNPLVEHLQAIAYLQKILQS